MGSISFAVGYNCLIRKQYQFAIGVNTVFAIGAKIVTDAKPDCGQVSRKAPSKGASDKLTG